MSLFHDSENFTVVGPYQVDDDYGSDNDFDLHRNTSGRESSNSFNYRQK